LARRVRLSALCLEFPHPDVTLEGNVERALAAVDEAIRQGADVICLPEYWATNGLGPEGREQHAEAAPGGPLTALMQERAARGRCYIASDVPERAGDVIYNACALIGRDGAVVGKYRKTHLSPGEAAHAAMAAGKALPVFAADFGVVGIMLCMDLYYPEVARVLALKGAEVLLWPTMTYGPTDEAVQTLVRARALENQAYVVASNFVTLPHRAGKALGQSYIVGPDGEVRGGTGYRPGVVTVEVDLDEKFPFYWQGERTYRDVFIGQRRPELYEPLAVRQED
jgi:predicted amidohydrolase